MFAGTGASCAAPLSVWSHFIGADADWLRAQAGAFTFRTGQHITIHAVSFDEAVTSFMGDERPEGIPAPDLFVGVPHDYLARSVQAGVVAPLNSFKLDSADDALALTAMEFAGKQYGLPLAAEAVALVYNRKLVGTPPRTWQDFLNAARLNTWGGRFGVVWDARNPYLNYGLIAAYGGYVFGRRNGEPDSQDIGLASPGAVKAAALLNDLIYRDRMLTAHVDDEAAKRLFLEGKAAMFLAGPWDMADLVLAGMDFGLVPLPSPPGATHEWSPFVSVYGVFVSAASTQQTEAAQFARQLTGREAQVALATAGGRIPASSKARADLRNNSVVSSFDEVILRGTLIPHLTDNNFLWQPWGEAMNAVMAQPQPNYTQILSRAVEQMKAALKR